MFDWFKPAKLPTPPSQDLWKMDVPAPMKNFGMDKVVMTATTDGAVKLDLDGYVITVPGASRHEFLEKIQKAVQMADVADPDNEPLNKVLK